MLCVTSHLPVVSGGPRCPAVSIRLSIKAALTQQRFTIFYQLKLHLLGHLQSFLLHQFSHGLESVLPQLYPLVCVAHTCIFHHGSKHHEETDEQINILGFHVGYLGQGGVDGVDEGGHGEDSGDTQPYPGWSCSSVEPEGDPGDDDNQRGGNVDLDEVVAH